MGNKTILGGGYELSKEQVEKNDRTALDWERFDTMLEICYKHYMSGYTNDDLAIFCRMIVNIGKDFEGEELEVIPHIGRNRRLGELITMAVTHEHERVAGKVRISNKEVFKRLVYDLVDKAHQDGHPKNKTTQTNQKTAFQFVADLMGTYGVLSKEGRPYSASTISNWCDDVANFSK